VDVIDSQVDKDQPSPESQDAYHHGTAYWFCWYLVDALTPRSRWNMLQDGVLLVIALLVRTVWPVPSGPGLAAEAIAVALFGTLFLISVSHYTVGALLRRRRTA
jgi:hypothetical protein